MTVHKAVTSKYMLMYDLMPERCQIMWEIHTKHVMAISTLVIVSERIIHFL